MLRFMDGFDHYAAADVSLKWNFVQNGQNNTTPPGIVTGRFANALSLGSGNGGPPTSVAKSLDSQPTWIVGFAYKMSAAGSAIGGVIASIMDGSNVQVRLELNTDNTLSVTRNGTALTGGRSSFALSANVWYYIELQVTISTSISANTCLVNVSGLNWINVAAGQGTQATANPSANHIQISGIGANYTVLFDDLYICDGTGSTNNAMLGDVRVQAVSPSGAGSHTDFSHTGAASNYQAVNETSEDGDTSYVYSSTVGAIDTYTMSGLSTSALSVYGVQVVLDCRKDDAGTRIGKAVVRSGGTDYFGPNFGIADSYSLFTTVFETDPATSAAWTTSGVNAMEAGVKLAV